MNVEDRFIQLIRENEGMIFKVTTFYTRHQDDQKDLYQEIVLQLWRAFGSFRSESKASTWLYRVAMNTAITNIRKEKKKGNKVPIDQVVLQYTENADPAFEERLASLYKHIDILNNMDKGIILLLLEEKSYEEIAEITGLSSSNVGTRLSRIKKKLKSQITDNSN